MIDFIITCFSFLLFVVHSYEAAKLLHDFLNSDSLATLIESFRTFVEWLSYFWK